MAFLNLIAVKNQHPRCVCLLHFPATNQNKLSRWHLRNVKCKTGPVQRSLLSALFSSFGFIVSVNQFDQSTALQLKHTLHRRHHVYTQTHAHPFYYIFAEIFDFFRLKVRCTVIQPIYHKLREREKEHFCFSLAGQFSKCH